MRRPANAAEGTQLIGHHSKTEAAKSLPAISPSTIVQAAQPPTPLRRLPACSPPRPLGRSPLRSFPFRRQQPSDAIRTACLGLVSCWLPDKEKAGRDTGAKAPKPAGAMSARKPRTILQHGWRTLVRKLIAAAPADPAVPFSAGPAAKRTGPPEARIDGDTSPMPHVGRRHRLVARRKRERSILSVVLVHVSHLDRGNLWPT